MTKTTLPIRSRQRAFLRCTECHHVAGQALRQNTSAGFATESLFRPIALDHSSAPLGRKRQCPKTTRNTKSS